MGIKFESRDEEIMYYHDEIIQQFKVLIKTRRKAMGLTQDRLAEIVGLRQPAISRLENPTYSKVNLETIQKVAAGLDCVITIGLAKRTEINSSNENSV